MTTSKTRSASALALAAALGLAAGTAAAQQPRQQPATPAVATPVMSDSTILPPQEIGTIAPGQIRRGMLEVGDWTMSDGTPADVWYLPCTTGQRVTITLRSSAFDSYLVLLDAGGTKLRDDDDSGGGGHASRIVWACTTSERLQVVVNYIGDDVRTGVYTLEVR